MIYPETRTRSYKRGIYKIRGHLGSLKKNDRNEKLLTKDFDDKVDQDSRPNNRDRKQEETSKLEWYNLSIT